MSISQEEKLSMPRMFIFITRVEDEKKLEEIFDSMHIPISYQCRGQGTAPQRSWISLALEERPGSLPWDFCQNLQ